MPPKTLLPALVHDTVSATQFLGNGAIGEELQRNPALQQRTDKAERPLAFPGLLWLASFPNVYGDAHKKPPLL
jgi:hypothetical protein